jgi:uncharacterized membrane protein YhaH (DUF805 family)
MFYYFEVLKKYAVFGGRARRKEYWMFYLFNILAAILLVFIEAAIGISSNSGQSLLVSIYQLAVFVPSLAVAVRRMHDVNKSGWYLLIPVYNLILALTGGTRGDNKYGSDPKAVKAEVVA